MKKNLICYSALLLLALFQAVTNLYFFWHDFSSFMFTVTPHYYINIHLKMLMNIMPAQNSDILFLTSLLLTKIFHLSLFVVRLSPTIAFLVLMVVICRLVTLLTACSLSGLLAAFLISFSPALVFYSRLYSHQIFFITIIYSSIYGMLRFFIKGGFFYFIFYVISVYSGMYMIKDGTSLELLFILYAGAPLLYLSLYVIKNRLFLIRYLLLLFIFLVLSSLKVSSYSLYRIKSFYLYEAFSWLPYPDTLSGWTYFLNVYWGALIDSVYSIPFIIFIGSYIYLVFVKAEAKLCQGINVVDFVSCLFIPFFCLSLLSKKEIWYISPLIPLIGIISAYSLYVFPFFKIKTIIIALLIVTNMLYFFAPLYPYDISFLYGKAWLEPFNHKLNSYEEYQGYIGFWGKITASLQRDDYREVKKSVYEELNQDQAFSSDFRYEKINGRIAEITEDIPGKGGEKEFAEELALLEYMLDYRLYTRDKKIV